MKPIAITFDSDFPSPVFYCNVETIPPDGYLLFQVVAISQQSLHYAFFKLRFGALSRRHERIQIVCRILHIVQKTTTNIAFLICLSLLKVCNPHRVYHPELISGAADSYVIAFFHKIIRAESL